MEQPQALEEPEIREHPLGDEIRRQVEYYFSDENLPSDEYLLEQCGGRENRPVSIGRILGFKKMRKFKPRSKVVASLRKSAYLDVTADGKGISRKVPLRGQTILDKGELSDDELELEARADEDERSRKPKELPLKEVKVDKAMLKPHGFETNFNEGPITPAVYEEEKAMYDPDYFFTERIDFAIQRFTAKRKMHTKYATVFGRWLKFGGIDFESRPFSSGITKEELEEMGSAEKARKLAVYSTGIDKDPEMGRWEVDFLGVLKGFLSSHMLTYLFEPTEEEIEVHVQVLRAFYNYLLYHNVCAEYKRDVLECRDFCDVAEKELKAVVSLQGLLPGAFNVACSVRTLGHYSYRYIGDKEWAKGDWMDEDNDMPQWLPSKSFSGHNAAVILKTGFFAYCSDEEFELVCSGIGLSVDDTQETGLEVIGIEHPTTEAVNAYCRYNEWHGYKVKLVPTGILRCRKWKKPSFTLYDLPEKATRKMMPREFDFLLEANILDKCFVGLKFEAVVRQVYVGRWFIDSISAVYCSFYDFLPNELVIDRSVYKETVWLNEKGEEAEDDETFRNLIVTE